MGCNLWMEHEPHPPDVGGDLLEHLQPFPDHGKIEECEAGDVTARTCHADNQALADWIDDHVEDNRDAAGRLFQRHNDLCATADNEVRCRTHQFRRVWLDLGEVAGRKSMLDLKVAVFHPSKSFKCLPKCRDAGLHFRIVLGR